MKELILKDLKHVLLIYYLATIPVLNILKKKFAA
jgi:hypothetical protein